MLDWLEPFSKAAGVALVITAIVWGVLEYACFWLTDQQRRTAGVVLGQACVFYVHWSNLYSFGTGPQGWALAMLLGLATAPLASVAHDQLVARFFPGMKAEAVGAKIASVVQAVKGP